VSKWTLARAWTVQNTNVLISKFAIVEPFNKESKQTIKNLSATRGRGGPQKPVCNLWARWPDASSDQ